MQRNFRIQEGRSRGASSGRSIVILLACLSLVACGSWRIGRPKDDVAWIGLDRWQAAGEGVEGSISSGWLQDFEDRALKKAVDEVLAGNSDLKVAASRMSQARESRIAGRSRGLPAISIEGSANASEAATKASAAGKGRRYGLALAASWEVDLWGRLRDLNAADDADEQAARATFRGARLSLAANAAKSWCDLITAEQLLELSRSTLDANERVLRAVERLFKGGAGQGALDVQLARTNLAAAQRAVKATEQLRDEAARSYEVLSGRYPSASMRAGRALPIMKKDIPLGIPADLIERRPDLVVARAELFASARRADATRKALLPSLALSGRAGPFVPHLADLLDPKWLAGSIAGNFSQALDSDSSLRATARAAVAANEAAVHDYTSVALEALREVESALGADRSLADQEALLVREVEQAALAEKQAARDYSDGVNDDILRVLESQSRATNARSGLIRLRNERLQNRIDLHLALGGDFATSPVPLDPS
ncbi:MAG: efflux transporter outer membrane subunit [Verrucomicrobia bacterium]|nr:MAG: efflux transporter outer membrane subunit [Verrucomicrobiota bacterium]TAE89200.1 MAG: efflux transporter outer membrane subunit [Verrucomicrobiota bacterium]TAF27924.1 MAG: efflux transporter outer membrane subunit [Verrucomicrobiota bacterium]TAF42773.1 MAG: efflux transporter outer membrane subunit [Verrucomicrobiota bacterium]